METREIEPKRVQTTRLVKSEDLNHHGTLFAGRTAEWFVEAGFISATKLVPADNIVCLKIHGLYFTRPVRPGQIVRFTARVVYAGKSSMVSYIEVFRDEDTDAVVSGFITFVYVDEHTHPCAHGITIKPLTDEDRELFERAKNLKKS